jgi:hypothetical protein
MIDAVFRKESYEQNEWVSTIQNVSNKELMEALENCGHDGYYNVLYYPIIEELKRRLRHRKGSEPQREKGKWIIDYTDEGFVECPFCHSATNCDGNVSELHFCFSCGADMRTDE